MLPDGSGGLVLLHRSLGKGMRQLVRWMAGFLAVALLVMVVLFAVSRLRGPSGEQRDALALLKDDTRPRGRNAFPAIWLLPYAVPPEQLTAITAQDMADLDALPYEPGDPAAGSDFESSASEYFPRAPAPKNAAPVRCKLRGLGCLAQVRANLDQYRQWRVSERNLIERVLAIQQYDYFRNQLPARADAPFPEVQLFSVLPTLRALDFADGRVDEGLTGACNDISMWRKLSDGSDMLIFSMIAVAGLSGSSQLLVEMLQEIPAGHPLPASCGIALQPLRADEFSMCNSMRGEAKYMRYLGVALESADSPVGNVVGDMLFPVFFDPEGMVAITAPAYAWPCSQEAASALTGDRALHIPVKPTSLVRLECVANFAGCALADIGAPSFDTYLQRGQDARARMLMLGTVVWMREHAVDAGSLKELLAARPRDLKSPTRAIEITTDGGALTIEMFDAQYGKQWQVRLPDYLFASDSTTS